MNRFILKGKIKDVIATLNDLMSVYSEWTVEQLLWLKGLEQKVIDNNNVSEC